MILWTASIPNSTTQNKCWNYNYESQCRKSRKAGAQIALRKAQELLCVFTQAHEWPVTQTQLWGDLLISVTALSTPMASWGCSLHTAHSLEVDCCGATVPLGGGPKRWWGREILSRTEWRTVHLPDHFLQKPEIQIYIGSWAIASGLVGQLGAWKEQDWRLVTSWSQEKNVSNSLRSDPEAETACVSHWCSPKCAHCEGSAQGSSAQDDHQVDEWISISFLPQLPLGPLRNKVGLEAGTDTTYPSKDLTASPKLNQPLSLARL